MFQKTFDAKVKKYEEFHQKFTTLQITSIANKIGVDYDSINVCADKDSVYKLAMKMVNSIMKGNVTPEVFCAAVATICDQKGVSYKKYCGFAIPKDVENYDKNIKQYNDMKVSGKEHPMFANHIYLDVNGTCYDLFRNVLYADVNHLDCLEF